MVTHRTGDEPGTCDICGKELLNIWTHKRTIHGITKSGKRRGVVKRRSLQVQEAPSKELVRVVPTPNRQFREMPEFVVLTDQDGSIWLAERIR